MISALDYLDADASHVLAEHIKARRTSKNVMKELNRLIDVNICATYLESFDFCKSSYNDDPKYNEQMELLRLNISDNLLKCNRKTRWLTNWPTKFPDFYRNRRTPWPGARAYQERDTIVRINREDYIIKEMNWKLKIFPPDKDKYQIDTLKMIKNKKKN